MGNTSAVCPWAWAQELQARLFRWKDAASASLWSPGAQRVGRKIRETSGGWPRLEVNPELPFTVSH